MIEDENRKWSSLVPLPAVIAFCLLSLILNVLSALPSNMLLMPAYVIISTSSVALLHISAKFKNKWLFLLLPLSFLAALLITRDAFSSLNSLLAFPAGYILAVQLLRKNNKTTTVLLMTAATFTVWALVIFCQSIPALAEAGGSVFSLISNTMTELEAAQRALFDEHAKMYYSEGYGTVNIEKSISAIMAILPARAVVSITVISYLAASLCPFLLNLFGLKEKYIIEKWEITLSPISAGVYLVSFVMFAFLSLTAASIGIFCALIYNLTIILMPCCAIVGFKKIFAWLSKFENKSLATIMKILYVITAIFNTRYAVYLTSVIGAAVTLITAFDQMKNDKDGGQN